MVKKIAYVFLASGTLLMACTPAPHETYFNRGEPESLLDLTTEAVNLDLKSPASIQQMTDVIRKAQPHHAKLYCNHSAPLCNEARNVMTQFDVPVKYEDSDKSKVSLFYEETQVRNCQNRYIDITASQANLQNVSAPTFGCSTAENMVQMVTDKRQFTDPGMLPPTMDATKPLQVMSGYDMPNYTASTNTSTQAATPQVTGDFSGSSR